MSNARRLFAIPGSLALDTAPVSSKRDGIAVESPSRSKPKIVRLTALLFGRNRPKSTASSGRGAASLDLSMDVEHSLQVPSAEFHACPATGSGAATRIPGRRSESRFLAFLGSKLSGECPTAPACSRSNLRDPDSTHRSSGQQPHLAESQLLSRREEVALCAVAISAPTSVKDVDQLASDKPNGTLQQLDSPAGQFNIAVDSSESADMDETMVGLGWADEPSPPASRPVTQTRGRTSREGNGWAGGPAPAATLRATVAARAPPALPDPVLPSPVTHLLAMSASTPAAMQRPTWSLDDYAVERRLYKSQTSSVYLAVCLLSGLPVALKVYNLAQVPSNVFHMIRREIKIQSKLVHKNVVLLYGAFQDMASQRLVLVQEYAANGDLHDVHRALRCRMSEDQARVLVLQPLLDAVVFFHAAGIVHRDIKPDNILFTSDWRLLLADFGVAIDTTAERAVTRAGTVGYMAPEVERCPIKSEPEDNKHDTSLAYTTTADVWAIGCLAYMLLLGFPPYIAGSYATAGSRALSFPTSTSQAARGFICAALAEHPEDRPTVLQLRGHPWMQP